MFDFSTDINQEVKKLVLEYSCINQTNFSCQRILQATANVDNITLFYLNQRAKNDKKMTFSNDTPKS